MKHFYLRSLFAGLLLFAASNSFAYDFEVDGIYYNIISEEEKTVEVTSGGNYAGNIVIPERVENDYTTYTVTGIGDSAFENCKDLISVVIPNTAKNIGYCAFEHCINLMRLNIPNSVTSINGWAFAYCKNLSTISLPKSITSIAFDSFLECSSLSTIVIPNSVKRIGMSAFYGCTALTNIIIPNSVTSIGNNAFYECSALNTIFLPNSIKEIEEGAFRGCYSLTNINIPNTISDIAPQLFYGCRNLKSIDIPNNVRYINDYAFAYCTDLYSISIPNSVKWIGNNVIHGCFSLQEITSFIEEPFEIPETTFQNYDQDTYEYVFTDATLYVPVGTKELYESTPGWNLFKNIVEMGLTPVEEDNGEKDFGADAGISEDTKMDGNIVNDIFYNILEDNGFYNCEEGCIVIKKETVDEFLDYIENKNLFSDEVKQQFTGLALMLKANCQWLKITAEASGNMTLKVKIGNMPPMEMALDGKKTVEFPCSLAEPSLAYIYGSLLPHAGAKGTRRAKAEEAEDELKIYSIAWSEEQEASGIRQTEQQDVTVSPTVYNLQGQRVLPTRQGIYVVNGKKLFVK